MYSKMSITSSQSTNQTNGNACIPASLGAEESSIPARALLVAHADQ